MILLVCVFKTNGEMVCNDTFSPSLYFQSHLYSSIAVFQRKKIAKIKTRFKIHWLCRIAIYRCFHLKVWSTKKHQCSLPMKPHWEENEGTEYFEVNLHLDVVCRLMSFVRIASLWIFWKKKKEKKKKTPPSNNVPFSPVIELVLWLWKNVALMSLKVFSPSSALLRLFIFSITF